MDNYRGINDSIYEKYEVVFHRDTVNFPLIDDLVLRNNIIKENAELYGKYNIPYGFQKSRYLYGIDKINSNEKVYITEGIYNMFSFIESGYENVVALLGSTMSKEQIELLKDREITDICLALDNDSSGVIGTNKIGIDLMKEHFNVSTICNLKSDRYLLNKNKLDYNDILLDEKIDFKDYINNTEMDFYKSYFNNLITTTKFEVNEIVESFKEILNTMVYMGDLTGEQIADIMDKAQSYFNVSDTFVQEIAKEMYIESGGQYKEEKDLFHGSSSHFLNFDEKYIGHGNDMFGYGFYLTDNEDTARSYALTENNKGYLYSVSHNLSNPIILDGKEYQSSTDIFFSLDEDKLIDLLLENSNVYNFDEEVYNPLEDIEAFGVLSLMDRMNVVNNEEVMRNLISEYIQTRGLVYEDDEVSYNALMSFFGDDNAGELINGLVKVTGNDGIIINFESEQYVIVWDKEKVSINFIENIGEQEINKEAKAMAMQRVEHSNTDITIHNGKITKHGNGMFEVQVGGLNLSKCFVNRAKDGTLYVQLPSNKNENNGKHYPLLALDYRIEDKLKNTLIEEYTKMNTLNQKVMEVPRTLLDNVISNESYKVDDVRKIENTDLKVFTLDIDGIGKVWSAREITTEDGQKFIAMPSIKEGDEYSNPLFIHGDLQDTLKPLVEDSFKTVEQQKKDLKSVNANLSENNSDSFEKENENYENER